MLLTPKLLLGAKDPEMDLIEEIARKLAWEYNYAQKDGLRVNPGNAYDANNIGRDMILVECSGKDLTGRKIDHHNPGDPGFGKDTKQFFPASSLGQIVGLAYEGADSLPEALELNRKLAAENYGENSSINSIMFKGIKFDGSKWIVDLDGVKVIVPPRFVLQAAADNCLASGYAGQCPGIDISKLKELQVDNIAKATVSSHQAVIEAVRKFEQLLRTSSKQNFGNGEAVFDLRAVNLGEGYSLDYLALKEAAARGAQVYLIKHRTSKTEPPFIMLNGNPTPNIVQHFVSAFASETGLVRVSGNPQRGYAIGYLPK